MSSSPSEIDSRANHLWLVDQFVQLAMHEAPRSVLDVGCGSGVVMRAFREEGVAVRGIDRAGPTLDELRADGFDACEGSAYALPADDASQEWVLLRHIPHHLEDPTRAFAEAWRVARRGVWILEPCYELSLPEGRAALDADRFEKRQQRRAGRYHADVYDTAGLLALLPPDMRADATVFAHTVHGLARRSVADFLRDAEESVADLPEDHAERASLRELTADLRTTGLAWNGSLCLTVCKT